ncbi:hypothetical protein [Bradyrhizobium sp. Leo121]|uniref:hypothetical protein n=1 Tax=Bradyrhizobium sp. Leo121 TaxID=1571195 RepID=UPI0010289955|nr:hypothetical protein [Bradyrhizobium sp. Leo121]RZN16788.1 hypothetical protein CWO90_38705 [Bradyrhizobium sp. Leo121]
MDRIARPDPRRDDDAVSEFAQLEACSFGIGSRKRFRELLHRIEIDGDSRRMQGDDVRLGRPIDFDLIEQLTLPFHLQHPDARSARLRQSIFGAQMRASHSSRHWCR